LSYPQPDTYQGENWVDPTNMNYDNGGIHFNNGVFNYWFYLLTEGGEGENDNEQSYKVEGIGMQKTEKLLMHIILNYLEPEMNYAQMRMVSQEAALELWGEDSEELAQVKNAWYAVGVEEKQNGVDVENITMLNIYSADNKLMVETVAGNNIEVYNTLGQLIVNVESQMGITTIPVALENSVVIVKVGNAIEKVLVK
jgi:hypothetical protein